MTPELFTRVSSMLGKHEGRSLYMYRDTRDIVTCAIGHALFSAVEATKCQWWKAKNVLASYDEIIAEYNAVKAGARGKLMMTYEESDRILQADLTKFEVILREEFPQIDRYPIPAQTGMYDICYNCGSFREWPHLTQYIKLQMWDKAALECYRPAVSKQRNEDTKNLFLSCVSVENVIS